MATDMDGNYDEKSKFYFQLNIYIIMINFIKKYWIPISWLITVIVDLQNGILEGLISNPVWISLIRILGAGFLAYFTEKNLGIIKSNTMTHFITVEKEATEEEQKAIEKAIEILDEVGLKLIGTRPKDR